MPTWKEMKAKMKAKTTAKAKSPKEPDAPAASEPAPAAPSAENSKALAGRVAEAVKDAMASAAAPEQESGGGGERKPIPTQWGPDDTLLPPSPAEGPARLPTTPEVEAAPPGSPVAPTPDAAAAAPPPTTLEAPKPASPPKAEAGVATVDRALGAEGASSRAEATSAGEVEPAEEAKRKRAVPNALKQAVGTVGGLVLVVVAAKVLFPKKKKKGGKKKAKGGAATSLYPDRPKITEEAEGEERGRRALPKRLLFKWRNPTEFLKEAYKEYDVESMLSVH